MNKKYITAQELLEDSFRVAAQVFEDGFRPQFIIGIWRGGAPIGIAVQEYFDYKKVETDHIAVRTSSYYGIGKQAKEIKVHGLHYLIENANAGDGLLIPSGKQYRHKSKAIGGRVRLFLFEEV